MENMKGGDAYACAPNKKKKAVLIAGTTKTAFLSEYLYS